MISVTEARDFIKSVIKPLNVTSLPILACKGLTLASDIYSMYDAPSFRQSSMDGYAFKFKDLTGYIKLKLVGTIAAGDSNSYSIGDGQAMRVFTGAPIPIGSDTVVMQEKVTTRDGFIEISDESLTYGINVREAGSELQKNKLVLSKGELIKTRTIGFLAGLGIDMIKVYPPPSVSIIITGNELLNPGDPLVHGKVFESNSYTLTSVLKEMNILDINVLYAQDDLMSLTKILSDAVSSSDVVLLTGGVSVGDYDFVLKAAENNGLQYVYHKIAQKPGKPMYFGIKEDTYIFGLPGNPGSVLTCFYMYVEYALGIMMNRKSLLIPSKAKLNQDYKTSPSLTHFLKGKLNGDHVTLLDAQESYRLKSFAEADCLIVLPPRPSGIYSKNEEVEIQILNG